jgi:preprotein translocase subunit SecB
MSLCIDLQANITNLEPKIYVVFLREKQDLKMSVSLFEIDLQKRGVFAFFRLTFS